MHHPLFSATRRPRAFVTGGETARIQVLAQCDDSWFCAELIDTIDCGGPLDATEFIPAGRVFSSHGRRFHELTARADS